MPFGAVQGGGTQTGSGSGGLLPYAGIGAGTLLSIFGNKNGLPSFEELNDMFGSGALTRNTRTIYNFLAGSPEFRNALNINALAGSNLSRSTSAGLAKRGLTTTGIGSIAGAIGGSAAQFGESGLRGGLFNTAGGLAQQNLSDLLQAYLGIQELQQKRQNPLQMLGSSLLTAGANALL